MNIESKIQQLLQKSITEKDKRKRMWLFHEISILNDYAILFEQKDFRILQRKYYRKEDYLFSKKENLKNQKIFLQSFHLEREYHQIFWGWRFRCPRRLEGPQELFSRKVGNPVSRSTHSEMPEKEFLRHDHSYGTQIFQVIRVLCIES